MNTTETTETTEIMETIEEKIIGTLSIYSNFFEDGKIYMELSYIGNGKIKIKKRTFANEEEYNNFMKTFSFQHQI